MNMNAEGGAVDGDDIESSLLRLDIEEDNDGCNDDIEALVSRANDLSTQFDLAKFAIGSPGEDDDELEGDYESITTDEGDNLPHETGEEVEGLSPGTAGNDFALAERTSNIISSYRDYLTQIDEVTATNQRLTEEMNSLRGSLGVKKVSSPTHTETARTANLHSREIGEMEFQEELRTNKYSQPLLHSRQIKKRLLGATLGVAILGSVAVTSYYAAESAHAKNLPDWDGELTQAMAEEEATKETMIQEAASRWASTGMVQRATNTTQDDESNEVHAESPAMTIIEDLIAHPEDVDKVTAVSTEGGHTISKKGSKSQKAFASKSAKSSSTAKSGKTMKPKADKKSASTSKSGKSSVMVHVETVSETPPSALASFSVTDELKEEAKEPQPDSVEDEPEEEVEEAPSAGAVAGEDQDEPAPEVDVEVEEEEEESEEQSSEGAAVDKPEEQTLARPSEEVAATPLTESVTEAKESRKKKQHNPAAIIQSVMSAKQTRAADLERLHTESAQILYEAISAEYNPVFFDRSQGWEGKTFGEAAYFCDQHYPHDMHGHPGIPCPYEVYCPEGPNSIPYGGYRSGTSFAPIIDSQEHWIGYVQLSQGHSCVAYNDLRPAPTYEQMDLITCCKDTTR